jgi:hypothetical protein
VYEALKEENPYNIASANIHSTYVDANATSTYDSIPVTADRSYDVASAGAPIYVTSSDADAADDIRDGPALK